MTHHSSVQAEQLPPGLAPPTLEADLSILTVSERRYLTGPLIQPRLNGWDFPDRLREIVPIARWLQILRGHADASEQDLASEEEALGYLSCASLDAPLSRDWAEIFFHLGQQVFPRWGMVTGQAVHEALGFERPVALNSQQAEDLRHFRRWLRRKIEDGAKAATRRGAKRQPSNTSTNNLVSLTRRNP